MLPGLIPVPVVVGGGAVVTGYQIARSLRFNVPDAPYLNRATFASPTGLAMTVSFWTKVSALAVNIPFFASFDRADYFDTFYLGSGGKLIYVHRYNNVDTTFQTDATFRDPTAWLNICLRLDPNAAVNTDRCRMEVNGVAQALTVSGTWTQGQPSRWATGGTTSNGIGRGSAADPSVYVGGYLADFHMVDGQVLTASNFGELSSPTTWVPKKYTGTYGVNGFRLDFADNSAATAAALGKDRSGNGNDWTPNSFSVTAGEGNDSLVDTPNNYGTDTGVGGEVRGNYCTLDPVNKSANINVLNGNLDPIAADGNFRGARGTVAPATGKWFFLCDVVSGGAGTAFGIGLQDSTVYNYDGATGSQPLTMGICFDGANTFTQQNGGTAVNRSFTPATGNAFVCAWDADAKQVWLGMWSSGAITWAGGGNPATATTPTFTYGAGTTVTPFVSAYSTTQRIAMNFGQRAFKVAAPSGFKVLCTQNLPVVGYQIARSLRFRRAVNCNLYRTPGVGSRTTWTFHARVKRGGTVTYQTLFSCYAATTDTNYLSIYIGAASDDRLYVSGWNTTLLATSRALRDYAAWYDIVVAIDTNQAIAAQRIRIYINGVEETSFAVSNIPAQGTALGINQNGFIHYIGCAENGATGFFDAYLADVHFVDAQQLTGLNFNTLDAATGQYLPKKYTGTYGANGFYLDFVDISANTATGLGADHSGSGNNWNLSNFVTSAGVTNDSFVDTPTSPGYGTDTGAGGEVRSNYATLNPIAIIPSTPTTIRNGNLDFVYSDATTWGSSGTFAMRSGKWFGNVDLSSSVVIGIIQSSAYLNGAGYPGDLAQSWGYFSSSGAVYNNAAIILSGLPTASTGCLMWAFDADTGKLYFGKDGTWFNSGNPAAGTGQCATVPVGGGIEYLFAISRASGATNVSCNFGQRPFTRPAPAGFKVLCTANLPDPAIIKPSQYMDVNLRTGTGANANITGKIFQPDLVWVKSRNTAASDHAVFDSTRGPGLNLRTNTAALEVQPTPNDSLVSFNADGFSLGANVNSGGGHVNVSGSTYVDWLWKKGTIPGFAAVAFTASTGVAVAPHGLGVAPKLVIVKSRTGTVSSWAVWHASLANPSVSYLYLNTTDAALAFSTMWGASGHDSVNLNFTVGGSVYAGNHIAYAFAEVPGFSKFGSYVGNAAADGPFVWCGFKPRFVMVKRIDSANDWGVFDALRPGYNVIGGALFPDLAAVEDTGSAVDLLSNGFKIRGASLYYNGSSMIYAAFAETPFKFARAR